MNSSTLNPLANTSIVQRYNANCLSKKVDNKTALQKELGWIKEPKKPILCFPAGMTNALGGKLLEELMPGLLTLPAEFLILGKGSKEYGSFFSELSKKEPHRVHIVEDIEEKRHMMYAASDMALFLSDATELEEIQECLRFGVVPIAPASESIEEYDPIQEVGYSFLYKKETQWHSFAAVIRALETYRFPFDWKTIQKHAMNSVLKG